jgi:hypothetical protein
MKLDEIDRRFDDVDHRFEIIDRRFDTVDDRFVESASRTLAHSPLPRVAGCATV